MGPCHAVDQNVPNYLHRTNEWNIRKSATQRFICENAMALVRVDFVAFISSFQMQQAPQILNGKGHRSCTFVPQMSSISLALFNV
jgi:hypothetical protein